MEIKLNLLSEAKKTEVHKKKMYRLIVWQEIIIISLVLFYGGMLFAIRSMHAFQLKNLEAVSASASQKDVFQEIDSAEDTFKDVNQKVSIIKKFQQEHMIWSNFFIALNETIPDGILLDRIVTANRKISISGKADTRDNLLKFQESLNKEECFENAQVPLADLFTQSDIIFQLDVDITNKCLKPGNV